ncbi:MAG: hypothetical protein ACI9VT_002931 [Psychroserpens sp.]|jgi:hypothetical protein
MPINDSNMHSQILTLKASILKLSLLKGIL